MSTYNGNAFYLAIDSTDLSAYVTQGQLTPKVAEVDVTAGASTTHMERAAGLADYAFTATVVMDDTTFATQIAKIKPGIHTVEWGPQGATSGKPRHVQSMLITEAPHEVKVSKDLAAFTISATGAAAPSVDLYEGGAYS